MLSEGEFHTSIWEDGVEVWVTQMGNLMNMNTGFVDRANEIVAIVDPFDAEKWCSKLEEEGLRPTHLLYTHTHRDHAAGFPGMIDRFPDLEVWDQRSWIWRFWGLPFFEFYFFFEKIESLFEFFRTL